MLPEIYQCLETEEGAMPSKIDGFLKKHGISVRSVPTHTSTVYRFSLQVKGNPKVAVLFCSAVPAEAKKRDVIVKLIFSHVKLDMLGSNAIKELGLLLK